MARYGSGPILGPMLAGLAVTVGGLAAVAVALDVPVTAEPASGDGMKRPQPTLQAMVDPGAVSRPLATDAADGGTGAIEAKPVKLRPAGPVASDRPVRQIMPYASNRDLVLAETVTPDPAPPVAAAPAPPPGDAPAVADAREADGRGAEAPAAEVAALPAAAPEVAAVDAGPVPRPRPVTEQPAVAGTQPDATPGTAIAGAEPDATPGTAIAEPVETAAADPAGERSIEEMIDQAHDVVAAAPKPAVEPDEVAIAGAAMAALPTGLSSPDATDGALLAYEARPGTFRQAAAPPAAAEPAAPAEPAVAPAVPEPPMTVAAIDPASVPDAAPVEPPPAAAEARVTDEPPAAAEAPVGADAPAATEAPVTAGAPEAGVTPATPPPAPTADAAPAETPKPAEPVEVAATAPALAAPALATPAAKAAPSAPVEDGQTYQRMVVRDARTLFATGAGGAFTYSLQYVKAPEFNQVCRSGDTVWRCGAFARSALSSRIGANPVTCGKAGGSSLTPGKIPAVCVSGGEDMGLWMVAQGLALPADGAPEPYRAAAKAAADAGRGVWASAAPSGAATVKGISAAAEFEVTRN
ncbi:thermonuclease family protein [Chthonobacter rhizosphaerae]|uniref:thermonuclease family protein n=1 Tax=Chthonobacter rhizosphaerae TaxID=2735553 RepID=UPI0015EE5358|nr:hypothetical protein [Chthonobacter rhizosphaerae]